MPETLLGRLVFGRLFVIATASTPALTIDYSLGDPTRRGTGALGDGTVKDPLDRLVVLLQALVEEAEMALGSRIGGCPAALRWWCRRRMVRTRDGSFELVV